MARETERKQGEVVGDKRSKTCMKGVTNSVKGCQAIKQKRNGKYPVDLA